MRYWLILRFTVVPSAGVLPGNFENNLGRFVVVVYFFVLFARSSRPYWWQVKTVESIARTTNKYPKLHKNSGNEDVWDFSPGSSLCHGIGSGWDAVCVVNRLVFYCWTIFVGNLAGLIMFAWFFKIMRKYSLYQTWAMLIQIVSVLACCDKNTRRTHWDRSNKVHLKTTVMIWPAG